MEWSWTPNAFATPCVSENDSDSPLDVGVPKNQHPRDVGEGVFEQLQPLPAQLGRENAEPRDIASWSSQARDDTVRDRITHAHEYDRDRAGRVLGGQNPRRAGGDDHVDLLLDELGGESGQEIEPSLCVPILDAQVLSLDVTELVQAVPECLDARHVQISRGNHLKSYPGDSRRRLRRRRDGQPEEQSAERDDESGAPRDDRCRHCSGIRHQAHRAPVFVGS